jgi:predicted pyridoxine 5'-phosphate oxidase superfamily flavin-nucleotide-binding protein
MTLRYHRIMFTPQVRAAQMAQGSRGYLPEDDLPDPGPDRLTADEAAFVSARDSLYMATNGAGGWPYLQHRGGPPGFVRVLDDRHLGFADFRGNRQYISLGNLATDDRASLFFMDYANRARLKLIGRLRPVDLTADHGLAETLAVPGYRAAVERGLVVEVEAYEWNCPQHITPRVTAAEVVPVVRDLQARIAELEARLAAAVSPPEMRPAPPGP